MPNSIWHQRRLTEDKTRRLDQRSPYQRDRARILHSAGFRRLQAKTQVLGVGMHDFYRTRLTHSLEVSQIGTGILAQLKRKSPELCHLFDSSSLIESLCLAHDIGHPPFGHGGEAALNYMMRNYGGFEGNGQTLRILSKLEPYTENFGMNLSRRTLLGILKYPVCYQQLHIPNHASEPKNLRQLKASEWPAVKGIFDDDKDVLDWVLAPLTEQDQQTFSQAILPENGQFYRTQHKSLDASIMELADDIAYAIHDLEDAIALGIVSYNQWQQDIYPVFNNSNDIWIKQEFAPIGRKLFSAAHHVRKDAIGTLINGFVTAINIIESKQFKEPLLKFNASLQVEFLECLTVLKKFVYNHVVTKPEVQILEYKGQQIVAQLFEAFASDPLRLLPLTTQLRWKNSELLGENSHRIIADYISGMTDGFATKLHQQLFSPSIGAITDFSFEL